MQEQNQPSLEQYPPRHCPDCGPGAGYMDVLMFLGIQPDGYVCKACRIYYDAINGDLKRVGVVI